MSLDVFRAWLAAHCCCCGVERPVGKWEAGEWTELIMILPERANNPAWQCPACWRRIAGMAACGVTGGER